MHNPAADQDSVSGVSYSIVDEHRILTDRIDAATYEIEIFFKTPANQTQADVKRIIVLLEELRDIALTNPLILDEPESAGEGRALA